MAAWRWRDRLGLAWALLLAAGIPAQGSSASLDFAAVQAQAEALAAESYHDPAPIGGELARIGYDQYLAIHMRPTSVLWAGEPGFFRVKLFPAGFLYQLPVTLEVIDGDSVTPVVARDADFDWSQANLQEPPPAVVPLAGFRVLFPLHRPDTDDEVLVFLGASYFRLLGREQAFGISARGLAIDTGLPQGEQFPFFRHFWLVKPTEGVRELTVYALLDSPSVAGAYRFVLRPGTDSSVEVTASLFLRDEVELLGLAPLTSMFLAGENDDRRAGDLRPEVHDSDGLLIASGQGEWLWRPLANPPRLTVTAFGDKDTQGFGLLQRDRDFDHYRDLAANYDRRPGYWVEPLGTWGEGEIRLLEIPTDAEFHDNVTVLWAPRSPPGAGSRLDVAYRLTASLEHVAPPPAGHVTATFAGSAALPGSAGEDRHRRVIVEFAGGDLYRLDPSQPVVAVATLSGGQQTGLRVEALPDRRGWRAILDFDPGGAEALDLRLFLRLYDQVLTETWTYRWTP